MCGRFTLTTPPALLAERFGLDAAPALAPRFNIAPGQDVATIGVDASGRRRLVQRRWGLVPGWARDPRVGNRMINARAETLTERPAFRDAFGRRRCLVPADGFFEWAPAGPGPRQPYHVTLDPSFGGGSSGPPGQREPFGIAGLWECWRGRDGTLLESCTLITTEANTRLRTIHERMPVVLAPGDYACWLSADADPQALGDLLRPCPDEVVRLQAVSHRVNQTDYDDPACVAPVPEPLSLFGPG